MSETWEQTKARVNRMTGKLPPVVIERSRVAEGEPVIEKKVPLWEVRKITLPIDPAHPQGKVVLSAVSEEEADWWIEAIVKKAKAKWDGAATSRPAILYEKFLIDGTPRERNIYSNPARFCTEDFPDFKKPAH